MDEKERYLARSLYQYVGFIGIKAESDPDTASSEEEVLDRTTNSLE